MELRENHGASCCFSGHRPSKLPWGYDERSPACARLKSKLEDVVSAVYLSGIRRFICGMALGCDTYFAEAVLKLRGEHEDIVLEAALPCEGQADSWNAKQRERYFRLLAQCDVQTLLQKEYTKDCMLLRNRYMVDNSSLLIAVFDGSYGGTFQTLAYAKKCGIEIIEIVP